MKPKLTIAGKEIDVESVEIRMRRPDEPEPFTLPSNSEVATFPQVTDFTCKLTASMPFVWQGAEQGPMVREQDCEVLVFDRALIGGEIVKLADLGPELTPKQIFAEIKAEVLKRVRSLTNPDFNAVAEVVGAVLNECIDRGLILDDEGTLFDELADVFDKAASG